jgi:ABC-type uncharacterized transport system substrate-binding protein
MRKFLILLLMACLLGFTSSFAAGASEKNKPHLNNGKKWKLAYVETAPFVNYAGALYYLLRGLEEQGWLVGVDKLPFTWGQSDTKLMWKYIATQRDFSAYIEFLPDARFSLADMPGREDDVLKRFTQKKSADLIIVMGTVAGKLISVDQTLSPSMVFSTSNAVRSGIVKADDFSGRKMVWAHTDPERYKQQIEVFWGVFKFKNLGIVLEDSTNGRAYASIDDVEAIAKSRGFKVIRKYVVGMKNQSDHDRFFKDLTTAYRELAPQVQGFYYTIAGAQGLRPEVLREAFQPFYDNKVPVFSQNGDSEVRLGALMSVVRGEYVGLGLFGANQMIKLLGGASADSLPQIYANPPNIALNLEVAKKIGYKPSVEIMTAADKVFQTIE